MHTANAPCFLSGS